MKALDQARALLGHNATVEIKRCHIRELPQRWHPPLALPGCSGAMYGAKHDPNCGGNRQYVVIGLIKAPGGFAFNVVQGAGITVDDAMKNVRDRRATDRLTYALDGRCVAPPGGCGFRTRGNPARRPAKVTEDGTLICSCGSEMKPVKR